MPSKPLSALVNWPALNAALMTLTNEAQLQTLLQTERVGKNRPTFTKRIHARLNKVRADRERAELAQ